jgi:hypothetical protein
MFYYSYRECVSHFEFCSLNSKIKKLHLIEASFQFSLHKEIKLQNLFVDIITNLVTSLHISTKSLK